MNMFTELSAVVLFFWFQNASILLNEVSPDSSNLFNLCYGAGTIIIHYGEL